MKRKWLVALGFVLVVAVLVWVNLRQGSTSASSVGNGPKGAPLVKVVEVKPAELVQTVLAPGILEAARSAEVRSPFATQRVHLLIGLGDRVSAGQVLAELESDDFQSQVAGQAAQVARAELALVQLQQQAAAQPLLLAQKVESARAQLVQAEQALASAKGQDTGLRQRLEQAEAALLAAQSRSNAGDTAAPLRQKLQSAEAAYLSNPQSDTARQAYDAARLAYEDGLRQAADAARQSAADLAQAESSVAVAQQEVEAAADQAGVRQASAAVEAARAALAAAQQEAESGGTLAEQIRAASADLNAARLAASISRDRLAAATLKAPMAGTVLSLGLKEGQPAVQGQLLLTLGQLETVTLRARVDEVDVGKVKPGQSLTLRSQAYGVERFTGTVVRVAAEAGGAGAGGSGASYEVQCEIANPDGKLRAGMNGEARILTAREPDALAVGQESVREEGDKAFVLVVDRYQVAIRPVKLGLRTETQVQVLEGLKAGEQVITSPFTLVRDLKQGAAVRIEVVEPEVGEEEP